MTHGVDEMIYRFIRKDIVNVSFPVGTTYEQAKAMLPNDEWFASHEVDLVDTSYEAFDD